MFLIPRIDHSSSGRPLRRVAQLLATVCFASLTAVGVGESGNLGSNAVVGDNTAGMR
jgi:hypothetical protein